MFDDLFRIRVKVKNCSKQRKDVGEFVLHVIFTHLIRREGLNILNILFGVKSQTN